MLALPVRPQSFCRCARNAAKYACPSCNTPYCCSKCYQVRLGCDATWPYLQCLHRWCSLQAHDVRCTEEFHATHVKAVLQLEKSPACSPHTVRHEHSDRTYPAAGIGVGLATSDFTMMEQALQDVAALRKPAGREEDTPCDDRIVELQSLAESSDTALCLDMLSPAERKLFTAALRSGKLTSEQEAWRPWWECTLEKHTTPMSAEVVASGIPCAFEASIPTFSSISSQAPAPSLLLHVVEVVYAYGHTMRLYCGHPEWDAGAAIRCILAISSVMSSDIRYESISDVFDRCTKAAQEESIRLSTGVSLLVPLHTFRDVSAIMATRHYLCDSLLHLQSLFDQVKTQRLRRLQKKLRFFTAWCADSTRLTDANLCITKQALDSIIAERLDVVAGAVPVSDTRIQEVRLARSSDLQEKNLKYA